MIGTGMSPRVAPALPGGIEELAQLIAILRDPDAAEGAIAKLRDAAAEARSATEEVNAAIAQLQERERDLATRSGAADRDAADRRAVLDAAERQLAERKNAMTVLEAKTADDARVAAAARDQAEALRARLQARLDALGQVDAP